LGLFGRGQERKTKNLRARAVQLGRLIETCQRALVDCTPEHEDVGGYRAAQRLRASMLEVELTGLRTQLDAVATEIMAIEAAARRRAQERRSAAHAVATSVPRAAATLQRPVPRLGFIAAVVAGVVTLLVLVTPLEDALGLLPTLIAHEEEVIEIDPRTLHPVATAVSWSLAPTPAVASAQSVSGTGSGPNGS